MNLPKDLLYTEEHEWIKKEDGKVRIGITDFAQDELGDIVLLSCLRKVKKLKPMSHLAVLNPSRRFLSCTLRLPENSRN